MTFQLPLLLLAAFVYYIKCSRFNEFNTMLKSAFDDFNSLYFCHAVIICTLRSIYTRSIRKHCGNIIRRTAACKAFIEKSCYIISTTYEKALVLSLPFFTSSPTFIHICMHIEWERRERQPAFKLKYLHQHEKRSSESSRWIENSERDRE